jgi:TonB family protein
MKIFLMAFCVWLSVGLQSESFEKRALSAAHRVSASSLDAKLPDVPFVSWFNELVGQEAGVVWQLAECGVGGGSEQDMPACAEATVLLPKGDVIIVGISVGTFKKGLIGEPAFMGAVIKSGDHLYHVRRLSNLPMALREPESINRMLPDLQSDLQHVNIRPITPSPPSKPIGTGNNNSAPGVLAEDEAPPPPPSPSRSRRISVESVEAVVIKKVKPVYPTSARTMRVSGKVEVRVVISENGRVIEATAISGHNTLRQAAVDAALQWVFKPATLNGLPVKTESVLPFTFTPTDQ